jgi:4-hydroxybenzoate polyprenyltransferase
MIGYVSPACLSLYAAGFCWTLVYDTIYALQDIRDDAETGIKSTALLFGDNLKLITSCFAGLSVVFLVVAGMLNDAGAAYFGVSCCGAAVHYAWQLTTLDTKSAADAWAKFKSNRFLGLIVAVGIAVDQINKVVG